MIQVQTFEGDSVQILQDSINMSCEQLARDGEVVKTVKIIAGHTSLIAYVIYEAKFQ